MGNQICEDFIMKRMNQKYMGPNCLEVYYLHQLNRSVDYNEARKSASCYWAQSLLDVTPNCTRWNTAYFALTCSTGDLNNH